MRHLVVGRDPDSPGKYVLVVAAQAPTGSLVVTRSNFLSWREARQVLDPEEFHFVSAAAFADWCRRNGWAP
jgi:hypothetical protein